MVVRVRQSARFRPGGRVRIRSNFPNKKITVTVPRGTRLAVRNKQA